MTVAALRGALLGIAVVGATGCGRTMPLELDDVGSQTPSRADNGGAGSGASDGAGAHSSAGAAGKGNGAVGEGACDGGPIWSCAASVVSGCCDGNSNGAFGTPALSQPGRVNGPDLEIYGPAFEALTKVIAQSPESRRRNSAIRGFSRLPGQCVGGALLAPRQMRDTAHWFADEFLARHACGAFELTPGATQQHVTSWILERLDVVKASVSPS